METKRLPRNDDERDEGLGSLLKRAADSLANPKDPDFAKVYARVGKPGLRHDFPMRRRHVLPLAAAAAAAMSLGLLLQQGASSGYVRDGLLYSHEISLLAHGVAGFHALPLFSGAAATSSVANAVLDAAAPTPPPSEELSNFVDDLWNRPGS